MYSPGSGLRKKKFHLCHVVVAYTVARAAQLVWRVASVEPAAAIGKGSENLLVVALKARHPKRAIEEHSNPFNMEQTHGRTCVSLPNSIFFSVKMCASGVPYVPVHGIRA